MKNLRQILSLIVSTTALICLITAVAIRLQAAEKESPAASAPSELAKVLVGAWTMVGTPDGEKAPEGQRQLKFIGEKGWMISISDTKTGKVAFHHGGTFTLKGDEYTETLEYANESTSEMIGQSFKFKVKVEGDTLTQIGVGNPYSQIFKRLK